MSLLLIRPFNVQTNFTIKCVVLLEVLLFYYFFFLIIEFFILNYRMLRAVMHMARKKYYIFIFPFLESFDIFGYL